jgi:hypothetical protein
MFIADVFLEDDKKMIFANAAKTALTNIRAAFAGEAERLGIKNEQDVLAMVDEVRNEMRAERNANNA